MPHRRSERVRTTPPAQVATRVLLLPYAIRGLAGYALIPILILVIACQTAPLPQVGSEPTLSILTPTERQEAVTPAPTATLKQDGLDSVECGQNCSRDYEPLTSGVEWLEQPTVSETGVLSLKVRVGEDDLLTFPNQPGGGPSNIALTNGRGTLYGAIIPPARPGTRWNAEPGFWVADDYGLDVRTLTVVAQIDARAANQRGLTLCLWTGGQGAANRVLDCIPVERP